jgi:hypothetical protein
MGNDCNCYKGGDSGNLNFKEKWDDITHPNETKGEKFVRKAGEMVDDLKDKAVDAYKEVKDKIT